MIIDIEPRRAGGLTGPLQDLNISYIDKNGDVAFHQLPLNQSRDGYIWEYCQSSLDRPHDRFLSWDNRQVKRTSTNRINKYRIEEIMMERAEEVAEVHEFNIPKKFVIDIETEITDGFPDPEFANNKVTAIAIANCTDKKVTVLAIRPLAEKDIDKIEYDLNEHFKKFKERWKFNFVAFESEYDMMYTFFNKLIHKMPCITGWNVMGFDWTYLVNRADKLKIDPSMASVTGVLQGKNRIPQHKLIIDYLDIVKKWDRVIKIKENYKLDYIGERATGISKIKYSGTLKDLYEKDFVKFVFYNAVDAVLVNYIDQALNTMTTFFKLASISKVEINRAFSPVWVQEALMTREFRKRGRVMVDTNKDQVEQLHFTGAYVKEPMLGMHEWTCCYDFASLYPNTMMQFNISPDSFIGNTKDVQPEEHQITCANGNIFDNKQDSVLRTILKELYAHRKETKKKMLDINKEIDALQRALK